MKKTSFFVLMSFLLIILVSGCSDDGGSSSNAAPIANAGEDQTVSVGTDVSLDGSGSSDPDGDTLTYTWSITSAPAASAAVLSDASAVNPTFSADEVGTFVITLVVADESGLESQPDEVTIVSENAEPENTKPLADAGEDQTVSAGAVVSLDGSGSSDPDGDTLTYAWSITSKPAASAAVLSDANALSPTFPADEVGTYVISLVVTDEEGLASSADEVMILSENAMPENAKPIANAGVDQSVSAGSMVSLDGSKSYDPDQDYPLTFFWEMKSKPGGSAAALSASDISNPKIEIDLAGDYTIQLTVADSRGSISDADTVTITSENVKPVADAGTDQTVGVGDEVTLDGSNSYDPNGNYPLAFFWAMTLTPEESAAALSASDTATPSFVADLPGEYTIELTVSDSLGKVSDPATVLVSTSNSKPVADAGPDQLLENANDPIVLDGRGSYDPDGDMIAYSWGITTKPPLSTAAFLDPAVSTPTFIADQLGTYVISLVVTDAYGLQSLPDETLVTSENIKPVAVACCNQVATVGNTVDLEGNESYDANLDPLTYDWEISSLPKDSLSELLNAGTVNPSVVTDSQGLYTVNLVVNDGVLDSDPSTVTILAVDAGNVDDVIEGAGEAVLAINGLEESDFYSGGSPSVLSGKLLVVIKRYLDDGASQSLVDKLTNDIYGKMDGCATSEPPEPDGNDWINNCEAQDAVSPYIEEIISLLEEDLLSTP